jgi:hypothetical protein
MSLHQAMLIAEWGPTTFYLNGAAPPDDASLAQLATRGVRIEPAPVAALAGEGRTLSAIELADGRSSSVDALYIGPATRLNSGIAAQLGCEIDEVGGHWRAAGMTRGQPYAQAGEFLEVAAPHRLVHTWDGAGPAAAPSTVTYLVEATEAGTRLTLRQTGFVSRELCQAFALGWETSLERRRPCTISTSRR